MLMTDGIRVLKVGNDGCRIKTVSWYYTEQPSNFFFLFVYINVSVDERRKKEKRRENRRYEEAPLPKYLCIWEGEGGRSCPCTLWFAWMISLTVFKMTAKQDWYLCFLYDSQLYVSLWLMKYLTKLVLIYSFLFFNK